MRRWMVKACLLAVGCGNAAPDSTMTGPFDGGPSVTYIYPEAGVDARDAVAAPDVAAAVDAAKQDSGGTVIVLIPTFDASSGDTRDAAVTSDARDARVGGSLVSNFDFDVAVAPWTPEANAAQTFQMIDADGSASSGSLLVTNASVLQIDGNVMGGAKQCVPVVGSATYDLFVQAIVSTGQTNTGAAVAFYLFDAADCTGAIAGAGVGSLVTRSDAWDTSTAIAVASATTRSMLVRLVVQKSFRVADGRAAFDDVIVVRR